MEKNSLYLKQMDYFGAPQMKNKEVLNLKGKNNYTVQELIECIQKHGYLYDFKAQVQPNKPFSIKELAILFSNELIYNAYEDEINQRFAKLFKSSKQVSGDTLQLMEDILKAFEAGFRKYGILSLFLTSESDFSILMTKPLNTFYRHLERYPLEREALTAISRQLQEQYRNLNFINYLDEIVLGGTCASGFPDLTSSIFSLVTNIKVHLIQAGKKQTQNENPEGLELKAKAFFEKKPMSQFQKIKIEGFKTYNPEIEDIIKKLIIYLDVDSQQIPKITVNDNSLTIHTAINRQFKTHLREELEKVGVDIDNIPGHYAFIIKDISQLKDKLSSVINDRDENGIFNQLS